MPQPTKKKKDTNPKKNFFLFLAVHWKITLLIIFLVSAVSTSVIWFTAVSPSPIQAALTMPEIIPISFNTSLATPYGGTINMTFDCSTRSSCLKNPICTIVTCILQIPFVLQSFDNKKVITEDAFEVMREDVLEPQEIKQCKEACEFKLGFYFLECLKSLSFGMCPDDMDTTPCYCKYVLPELQKKNISPAGLYTEILKKAFAGTAQISEPAIAFVLFPDEGMPVCNATGNLLGQGFGSSVFFNIPGGLTPVGDNCRGSYYMITPN